MLCEVTWEPPDMLNLMKRCIIRWISKTFLLQLCCCHAPFSALSLALDIRLQGRARYGLYAVRLDMGVVVLQGKTEGSLQRDSVHNHLLVI